MSVVRSSLLLLTMAALLSVGCHGAHEEHPAPQLPVSTPSRKATEVTHEYVGQVRAIQHVEIRALERGYLEGVFVDEGQLVQAGHRMFQLMPRILQAEVHKAEAEAERAEIEFNNTKLLAEKKIVSPNELSLSKANRAGAQAQLQLAQVHRGLTEIRAPFTGIMDRFHARVGSLVEEGDLLTTLSDNSTVWVYFSVSESDYLQYMAQSSKEAHERSVQLRMANGQIFDHPGKVETIEGEFDNETGTIAFRAAFPNPEGLLRHGETGNVIMTTPLENALLIPQKATFDVLDRKFVYVIDEHHVVHQRSIEVLADLPQVFAVANGLNETDHVLLDGLRKVHDGSVIEPVAVPPAQALENLQARAE